jgi:hypothetical protein
MTDFICKTLSDPAIFWPALESIATVLALFFIYLQVRDIRREAVAGRVDGFRYAMEIVAADEFQKLVDEFRHTMDAGNVGDWPHKLPLIVRGILRNLEIVASLIRHDYMDEQLFLQVHGLYLGKLGEQIHMLEEGHDTPRLEFERKTYPGGRALLSKAEEWRNKISAKTAS